MNIRQLDAEAIFNTARKIADTDARREYLDQICSGDIALCQRVEALLENCERQGHFLRSTPDEMEATVEDGKIAERPGTMVGRFKLIERVGVGGMGSVWVAEQTEPVRRKVALKLIKLGLDSRQVVARFNAERQALALMDHPNIAKVFDGGLTEQGRPYFVMEYVKGEHLTRYCDSAKLSVRERLALFILVCQAVQHAHQKGIIHRDLKPANILACLYDGKPIPKVIDFGLAKAMNQPLTDQTLHTTHGMLLGTPLYMSPEQAEFNNLDVDTRTDIYSLGVILYELLTGSTPLEKQQLKDAAYNEIVRLIKEVEPQKPSTRLSGSAALPNIAAQRNLEPSQLRRSVQGELDWIVMKALDKERSRRYETANGLARDIERFLNNEPVAACPPNPLYKFKKFVRRNKLGVGSASAVAASLLMGLGISTWLWVAEREANHRMRAMMKFFTDTQILRTALPREYTEIAAGSPNRMPGLVPPGDSRLNGKTYALWAGDWLQWSLQLPLTNSDGAIHPWIASARFEVAEAQTSEVWFLAAPFGKTQRSCVIPSGKSLFFPLFMVETSNLESPPFYGKMADDQAAIAQYFAGHIVDVFCELDGIPLTNLEAFRVQSPQVNIAVPTPWIQGEAGGKGTAIGAGYFVFLSPLTTGEHTLHYGGTISLTYPQDLLDMNERIDMTYLLNVTE